MLTRRGFLKFLSVSALVGVSASFYSMIIEPFLRLHIKKQKIALPHWPKDTSLKIAVLTDIHACEPWMSAKRIGAIVELTNGLEADIVLLLGDYRTSMKFISAAVPPKEWAEALGQLKAPLGVHAVLGNHDWWNDPAAQASGARPIEAHQALASVGITVYENDAIRLEKAAQGFWLAGLGDQLALLRRTPEGRRNPQGVDDLAGTLSQITTDEPVLLMAHEPDIFPQVPERVALTLSGHTHGGQVTLFGKPIFVPSAFGTRYAYGHIIEQGRHLFVSGGLGFSFLPLRFGMPPEINVIEISA